MAQEYYNLEKTAEVLGIAPADVHLLRERNELHAYRDGANWKFKADDVQNKLAEMIRARKSAGQQKEPEDDEGEDVLLTELELGPAGTASGSVIGVGEEGPAAAGDSDLRLVQSGIAGGDMDVTVAAGYDQMDQEATVTDEDVQPAAAKKDVLEEVSLGLDDDATGEDSDVPLDKPAKTGSGSGSGVDLSEALDDDLVLGGSSGSGSDITIGGDSGISLIDPSDSGLSLEEPVKLVEAGEESLELGEDDMLVFHEDADAESPTELKTDDDFLLTPMGDAEEEDSESGSQVIALDTEGEGEEAETMVAAAGGGMAAMLDEDFAPAQAPQFAVSGAAAVGAPAGGPRPAMEGGPIVTLPEAPYTVWNIVSLTFCVLFLMLTGMMLYDLLRNMWSWSGAYSVNSSLMDMILGFLP